MTIQDMTLEELQNLIEQVVERKLEERPGMKDPRTAAGCTLEL